MITLPIPPGHPLIVFTDLDGTLIDHHSYGIEGSREALQKLVDRKSPLVFCSSKTFAEQVHLQMQLGIIQPFIFENGSAVAIPVGFFPTALYKPARVEQGYDLVVFAHADAPVLRTLLQSFSTLKGYAGASDAELTAATGLGGEALCRARERGFTETLLSPLNQTEVRQLNDQLRPLGFILSRGGRFFTVQSASVSKGKAVQWMMGIFRQVYVPTPFFAALGDSPNDVPMLEVVDFPFLVQGPDKTWADVKIQNLVKVNGVGPAGFSTAIQMLLSE